MSIPCEITFRGMSPSPAVHTTVDQWVQRLGRVCDRILRCDVWIDLPHRHHRHGASFQVRLLISVPGGEIVVGHDADRDHLHDDVYPAIADAFVAARRQLREYVRIRRDSVEAA